MVGRGVEYLECEKQAITELLDKSDTFSGYGEDWNAPKSWDLIHKQFPVFSEPQIRRKTLNLHVTDLLVT